MKKTLLSLIFGVSILFSASADEGMWLPSLLKQLNIQDMQSKGLRLSADDIYNINEASMKDGIVIFGRGCTGELISKEGLVLTNHHCGYGSIQQHSSVEHDYLTDGYWAMTREQELATPGLSVKFLVRIDDVTSQVLKGYKPTMTEEKRQEIVEKNINKIKKNATRGNNYQAVVKSFYYGNDYYMFVYQEFTDVRLVGAPPSSIGKFGGDTDNWMWPRHTGDFSLFRIYADKNNNPADYSPDNVPYVPKKSFKISLKGVNEGDFSMVLGYPGSTEEYLYSRDVDFMVKTSLPHKIALRTTRLDIMRDEMDRSDKVRIQYSSKYAGVANAWKKWKGIIRGLNRLDAVEVKKNVESRFAAWANSDAALKAKYGSILDGFNEQYSKLEKYNLALDYYREAALSVEAVKMARNFESFLKDIKGLKGEKLDKMIAKAQQKNKTFFKDYYMPIDQLTFVEMMKAYKNDIAPEFYPAFFDVVEKEYNGDFMEYSKYLYNKSRLITESRVSKLISEVANNNNSDAVINDPFYKVYEDFYNVYQAKVVAPYSQIKASLDPLYRDYMSGLIKMESNKTLFPDANFTMRVAYGNVKGYTPRDGVQYEYYSTLEGIMAKDNPDIYDYDVPAKLKELFKNKDYGQYQHNGTVPVAFVATNHTSGGNSGSPVFNANGELVGINFDRCWEGTMSDVMYDPSQCRNITLDVRYALFIIDKFAGATHLIDEMDIIK